MRTCLQLVIVLLGQFLFSQNEANIWYFGENAGLDFNGGEAIVLLNGQLNTNEGCATISDGEGNLLFYTDGVNVFNRNHSLMSNSGLLGSSSSTHSAIILPHPGDEDKYFIFTVDSVSSDTGGGPLSYSEVDMNLDMGLGDITTNKNIILYNSVNEKVSAISNSAEDGYWVISHKFNSDEFLIYEVNSTGVNSSGSTNAIGSNTGYFNVTGQIKISPDNSKLAVARGGEVQLFDFDNLTGNISNPQTIDSGTYGSYGIEFSADGNLLYVAYYGGVSQYNLQAGTLSNIIASQVVLISVSNEGFASMQIAPDGKIYIARQNKPYIDYIENPDISGLGCNYNYEGLYLNGRESKLGLPTFIQSFFTARILFDNNCLGEASTFDVNSNQTIDSILWDFGDGFTSTSENPSHLYTESGSYNVIATVTSGSGVTVKNRTITIFESPDVMSSVILSQCDDDLDGYSAFNLTEVFEELSTNYLNETISFYESQTDAELGENAISAPTNYTNQTVSTDIIWARVENANGCFKLSEVNLVVSTTQIPMSYNRDFYECDDDNDGIAVFNFSSVTSEIIAMFPSGQQLEITYYRNQVDALLETNAINNIPNYQNIGFPNIQYIFVRVDNITNNDCVGLGQHITLNVEAPPVANTISIDQECDLDGDGMFEFDTSTIQTELLNGQTNFSINYVDENGNMLPSPLPNPFLTTSQTVTAILTNNSSQNPSGGCSVEVQIEFVVEPAAIANPVQAFVKCDDDSDGIYSFDTSTIEMLLLNGQTNMFVTYTDSNGDTLPSPLPNPFVTSSQTITVKVQNQSSAFCYDETTIDFIVSESPIAYPVNDEFVCDDVSNDGQEVFILSSFNSQLLGNQSDTVFEVIFYDSQTNAQNNLDPLPDSYMVNSSSQTVFARIQNINNPSCFNISSFELGVNYLPIANQPENLDLCDIENDGSETFDLSIQNSTILSGQSVAENTITYHLTQMDAEADSNPIPELFTNSTNPQTLYARIENNQNSNCFDITNFELHVIETPVLNMNDLWAICEGNSVELIADEGFDSYLWSTGETTRIITVFDEGEYNITVTNIYGDLSCETTKSITVTTSDVAVITDIDTLDWTQNQNVITVFVDGNGVYEYSLDGINYQESNVFTNLNINEYTVYVRDMRGCGITTDEVYLLYYPHFFTPNGDGYNEYWQLINSEKEPKNKIFIYDRYGKLLKQLSPNTLGWDGTFNGNPMPSNDYWFILERQNGKTYKGHFTLKR